MLLERFHPGPKSILRLWGGGTSLGGKFEGPHRDFHSSSKASVLTVTPYVFLSYVEHA